MQKMTKRTLREWCKLNSAMCLIDEWDYKNNDVTPDDVSFGGAYLAQWKCKEGHLWKASVHERTSCRSGCPYCSNKTVLEGFNDLASDRPDLIGEWNYDKNTILPQKIAKKSTKKVWWKCSRGHDYQAAIKSRTINNTGCPFCANKKVLPGFNDLKTIRPDISKEWDSSNEKKPFEVTAGSGYKATWICSRGHRYIARVCDRTGPKHVNCRICQNDNTR